MRRAVPCDLCGSKADVSYAFFSSNSNLVLGRAGGRASYLKDDLITVVFRCRDHEVDTMGITLSSLQMTVEEGVVFEVMSS